MEQPGGKNKNAAAQITLSGCIYVLH